MTFIAARLCHLGSYIRAGCNEVFRYSLWQRVNYGTALCAQHADACESEKANPHILPYVGLPM